MNKVCGGDMPYIGSAELEEQHLRCKRETIRFFRNAKKMGGTDLSLQFLERLEVEVTEAFEEFAKHNNGKNLFKSMRTPAVLVCFISSHVETRNEAIDPARFTTSSACRGFGFTGLGPCP